MGTTITDLITSRVINSTWQLEHYYIMVNNKNSVMVALLVGSLATVALASTRYHGSHSGGFGGVGGVGGVGGLGGVGGFGNLGLGAGLGVGHGVGGRLGAGGSSGSCRYWCKTPQGQAYCCEGANEPIALPSVKPGRCPPVRPQCPPVRNFRPPTTCSNDSKCRGAEKCCYDTCLQEHTCKLPTSYY